MAESEWKELATALVPVRTDPGEHGVYTRLSEPNCPPQAKLLLVMKRQGDGAITTEEPVPQEPLTKRIKLDEDVTLSNGPLTDNGEQLKAEKIERKKAKKAKKVDAKTLVYGFYLL